MPETFGNCLVLIVVFCESFHSSLRPFDRNPAENNGSCYDSSEHEILGGRFHCPSRPSEAETSKSAATRPFCKTWCLCVRSWALEACPACHSTSFGRGWSRCQLRELSSIVMVIQTSPANATMIVGSWSLRGCAVFHLEIHGEEAIPTKTLEPPTANQTAFATEVVLCSLFCS